MNYNHALFEGYSSEHEILPAIIEEFRRRMPTSVTEFEIRWKLVEKTEAHWQPGTLYYFRVVLNDVSRGIGYSTTTVSEEMLEYAKTKEVAMEMIVQPMLDTLYLS